MKRQELKSLADATMMRGAKMTRAWNALFFLCGTPVRVVTDGLRFDLWFHPAACAAQAATTAACLAATFVSNWALVIRPYEERTGGEGGSGLDLAFAIAARNGYSAMDVCLLGGGPLLGAAFAAFAFAYVAARRRPLAGMMAETSARLGDRLAAALDDATANALKVGKMALFYVLRTV